MNKSQFKPIKVTELSVLCLRVRLSLQETQVQFAKRLHVTRKTISYWEHGHTPRSLPIYMNLLESLQQNLRTRKLLVSREAVNIKLRHMLEEHGCADNLLTWPPQVVNIMKAGSEITPLNQSQPDEAPPIE